MEKLYIITCKKILLLFLLLLDFNYGFVTAKESCSFPGSPAHSVVTFSNKNLSSGTVASYTCERGFELLGPIRRVCNNGSWTPEGIPFCVLNVAAGKAPMQISTDGTGIPQKAIDGSTSAFFSPDTCSETKIERYPWWYVNLLEPYMIQLVRLDFGKSCCGDAPATIVVRVGNNRPDLGTNPICNRFVGVLEEGQPLFLPCNPPMPGAFVSVHLESSEPTSLSICETFVYTDQALPIERCPTFRDQPPGASASYNGKCYTFYDRHQLTFSDALAFCKSRGGTLINESNPALQGFISWELWRRHRNDASSQYWMGAIRDLEDKTAWKWVDGGDVTVSFWNYPGGVENCARYDGSRGWLWTDTNCNSELNFICQHQPRTCGRPEQPPNSTIVSNKNFDIGAAIEYTCDKGHLMVGPSVRTCLKTGFYNEFPPVCKFIDCGLPASILHGNYILTNTTTSYLSTVKYSCSKGYEMIGRAVLNCDIDERWNGPPPRCEIVECDTLPTNEGLAIKTPNGTVFDSVAEISCQRGYKLEGVKTLRCLSTGQWSDILPKCVKLYASSTAPTKIYRTKPTKVEIPTTVTRKLETTTKPEETDEELPFLVPGTVREEFPSSKNTKETKVVPPTKRITETSKPPATLITRPPTFETTVNNNKNILNSYPQENEISGNVNIKQNQLPNVDENYAEGSKKGGHQYDTETAKLNLSSIIALGAFGGFVFLAAVITSIVVLIKRNRTAPHYRHRASPDCNTVASFDSSTTGSRNGLNRYYRQAWENLHESTSKNSIHNPLRRKDGFEPQPKRSQEHFHGQSTNNFERCNRDYVCDSLGLRDGSEMVISDVCLKGEKKRHHHHHHKSNRDQSRRY